MRIFVTLALALSLSGCVAALEGINEASHRICANKEAAQVALSVALTKAEQIADPAKREASVKAIQLSLVLLARCPDTN